MRIAFFSESYKPHISGVTRSVELLKKELELLGHEVHVFAPSYPGYSDKEPNVFRLPSVPTRYPGFRLALPYPGCADIKGFDIVHSHSPFQLGAYSKRLAKKNGIPFVYTFHTLFDKYLHYAPLPQKLSASILKAWMKGFISGSDAVVCPNGFTKEYMESVFGMAKRTEIVPSGIDADLCLSPSNIDVRSKFCIDSKAVGLVHVGRLTKEKNLPFLMNALQRAMKFTTNIFLLLVGDGPEFAALEALVSDLGLSANVIFAGNVNYPEVLEYYKAGDIFVFSSKTETQGLVIAEAKACGLVPVAVRAGGIIESIQDGIDGFLTGEDQDEYAEKLLNTVRDVKMRAEMKQRAVESSIRDFSSKNIALKIEKVYNSLIKS